MTQLVNVRTFPLVDRRRILPDDVVYIGRAVPRVGLKASPWANPYRSSDERWAHEPDWLRIGLMLGEYHRWLAERIDAGQLDPEQLRGCTLACWCPPKPCHGSVILEWLEAHPLLPAPGQRPELGRHRQPEDHAETAAAWPSRAAFARRFDYRHRRQMQRTPSPHA